MDKYTALVASNRSHKSTGSPKILFRKVVNLTTGEVFRDHCWVDITPEVQEMLPDRLGDNNTYEVTFEALSKKYYNRITHTLDKVTLTDICNGKRNPKPTKKSRKPQRNSTNTKKQKKQGKVYKY